MNDQQLLRYARHLMLDEIGVEGQQRLLQSHALVIGAGGVMALAILAHASGDEARHLGNGRAFQQALREQARVGLVLGGAAAPGAFAHRRQVQTREHRAVRNRTAPANRVRFAHGAILGRR